MTEQESQRLQIFNYMVAGNTITDAIAREMFGCSRLAARIAEIEALGFLVEREWEYKYKDGKVVKKWKRYWIATSR